MKKNSEIRKVFSDLRSALRYEYFNVLFDRWVSIEHCDDLPLNDLHQDFAQRITFGYGFSVSLGINALLWIFLVFFRVSSSIPAVLLTAAGALLLSLIGGALFGALYLAVVLIRIRHREEDRSEEEKGKHEA